MSTFLTLTQETIWLFLPAGIANMAPIFAAKYGWTPALAKPINEQIFGKNKTWRGLAFGLLFGSITGIIVGQGAIYGAALGFGAIAGDAVKSFFKRRLNITPGKSLPVADQIDFVIGAAVAASFFVLLTPAHIILALIIFGALSWLTSWLGVRMKIKNSL